MEHFDRKQHWEKIYHKKQLTEFSWYQQTPSTSLLIFNKHNLPKEANIIDIGGGDSLFVDHLLDLGYQNITVLDISEKAISKAKERLGVRSDKIKWINADIASFTPKEKYEYWHDRAAFHFLTEEQEISHYIQIVKNNIEKNGILSIGTFSDNGPQKCSGIEVQQYSEDSLNNLLKHSFEKIECQYTDHQTPSGSIQNFIFCSFRKT